MKKLFAITVCLIVATAVSLTASAAGLDANKQKVLDALKTTITVDGNNVSLPAELLNQAENYLRRDDVTISSEQATTIVAQVDEAIVIVKDSGVTNIKSLSGADKTAVLGTIREAGEVVNLTVSVDSANNEIAILSGGKLVASAEPALKVTGPDVTALIAAITMGIVLLAGCFVTARKAKLFVK